MDSNNYLVDPSTGYRVQRIGSDGMANNFQSASNSDIQIPYGASLPAKAPQPCPSPATSADESSPTTNVLTSGVTYTASSGADATASTLLSSLDQATNLTSGDKIVISGTTASGTIVGPTDFDIFTSGDTPTCKTVGNLVSAIQAAFPDTDVSLNNGQITVTDNSSGYSQTAVNLKFSGGDDDSLTVPGDLSVTTPGGNDTMTTSMDVYDSQGVAHTVDASFVKTNTPNTWDLVCSSISGDATITQGRIDGITFGADGSFSSVTQANPSLQFQFPSEGSSATSTVSLNFGTAGGFNGVSQLAGSSTIALSSQDGYASGTLSSMSVNQDGELIGVFSNGVQADIAQLKIATFQNPGGLNNVGNNYYTTSASSGDPQLSAAQVNGAALSPAARLNNPTSTWTARWSISSRRRTATRPTPAPLASPAR